MVESREIGSGTDVDETIACTPLKKEVKQGVEVHLTKKCKVKLGINQHYGEKLVADIVPVDAFCVVFSTPYLYETGTIFMRRANKYKSIKGAETYIINVHQAKVKLGNIIERNGHLYEVIKAQHTQHGRGGATMQVELRDLESGLKLTERLRTSEPIERVRLEDRAFTFLYEDGDTIFVMDPETFEQVEISKGIFGKRATYLTDGMPVTVSFHEGKALSASVPTRVTCTVAEAEPSFKGQSVSAQYKKLVLENGRTIMGPTYLEAGDKIVVNTLEDSYMERAAKR